jgi:hypothetical protein
MVCSAELTSQEGQRLCPGTRQLFGWGILRLPYQMKCHMSAHPTLFTQTFSPQKDYELFVDCFNNCNTFLAAFSEAGLCVGCDGPGTEQFLRKSAAPLQISPDTPAVEGEPIFDYLSCKSDFKARDSWRLSRNKTPPISLGLASTDTVDPVATQLAMLADAQARALALKRRAVWQRISWFRWTRRGSPW